MLFIFLSPFVLVLFIFCYPEFFMLAFTVFVVVVTYIQSKGSCGFRFRYIINVYPSSSAYVKLCFIHNNVQILSVIKSSLKK